MRGGDKDCASRVSSLTNEEPLVVVKTRVDIVRKVVGENCGNGRGSVVREGETPLRCGRCGSVPEGAFGAEDGDIGRGWSGSSHRGSKVLSTRGSDEDVVRVNGDIFVERGEEEGVKDFLSYLWGSGRHRCREKSVRTTFL